MHKTFIALAALALSGIATSSASAQLGAGPSTGSTTGGPAVTQRADHAIRPYKAVMPRVTVGLWDTGDATAVAADYGLTLVGEAAFGATFELAAPVQLTFGQLAALQGSLTTDARVRFAEPSKQLRTPETQNCMAPTTGVSGLPCTISFYDGDPAPEKFYEQPLAPIVDLGKAQSYLDGTPSLVAVIDTGVDATHSLLAGRIFSQGFDFTTDLVGAPDVGDGLDNDFDGLVDEAVGHGTHIAGTIALINPDAWILPLKVLDSDGNGSSFDVAEAIYFACASGAQVINLSLGMTGESVAVAEALEFAYSLDVEVFAAAGNTGGYGVSFPANHKDTVAVTAVDDFDVKADFASFGPEVELATPGVEIYSAMPGEAWAWWSGTSMATAVASGIASIVHSIDPHDGDGHEEMEDSCVDLELTNPELSHLLGHGRVDAGEAAEETAKL